MEKYLDDFSKMVLVAESLKEYKESLVKEKGIGEDLTFNLFGWRNDSMSVVAQLTPNFMTDKRKRLKKLVSAATVLRTGFGCDAISFGTEAFCVMKDGEVDTRKTLAEQFSTNTDVVECLLVLHVGDEIHLVAIPYRYGLGRNVIFGSPASNDDEESLTDIKRAFSAILEIEPDETVLNEPFFVMSLVDGMQRDGFEVTVIGDI